MAFASQFSFAANAIVEPPLSAGVHVHRQLAKFPFDQGSARYTVLILWTPRKSFQFAAYSFSIATPEILPIIITIPITFDFDLSIDFYRYFVEFSPGHAPSQDADFNM